MEQKARNESDGKHNFILLIVAIAVVICSLVVGRPCSSHLFLDSLPLLLISFLLLLARLGEEFLLHSQQFVFRNAQLIQLGRTLPSFGLDFPTVSHDGLHFLSVLTEPQGLQPI
ncbi:hypothetical protein RvY_19214-2 [Ramazzottius varieornatus]|uniref:Uncharacterized protein n=1 Tax=Ramazzottius varieornatus TaxID=947166 RepID=A0A1D1W8Q6_RAMVA|nr:hypothetical protein RvY_19214-2 [Ramazzottius varieornatus]